MSPAAEGKLSKEEVEALLQATREEEPPPEPTEPVRRVHGYDFLQPSRFNKAALEKLRQINEGLAQNATAHASRLLRTSVKTQLVSMDQMKWEHLVEEVGDAVVAFTFTMSPLGHRGVLTVGRQFAGACLDRLMGGPGETSEAAVDFTELDVRTFAAFVRGFLKPLPELWQNIGRFEVDLGPFVQDFQGLDLFSPTEDLFQLCFLMQGNIGSGQIALAVPFQAVRSLPPQDDGAESEDSVAARDDAESAEAGLRENLKRTTVELAVVLGSADVKVGRLVGVEPGDVIVLGTSIGDALEVKVNDKVKFRGYPGTANGKLAVKLIMEE
jgi:flagellar motor switch protein FliM